MQKLTAGKFHWRLPPSLSLCARVNGLPCRRDNCSAVGNRLSQFVARPLSLILPELLAWPLRSRYLRQRLDHVGMIDKLNDGRNVLFFRLGAIPQRAKPDDLELMHALLEHVEGIGGKRCRYLLRESWGVEDDGIVFVQFKQIVKVVNDALRLFLRDPHALRDGHLFEHGTTPSFHRPGWYTVMQVTSRSANATMQIGDTDLISGPTC